MYKYKKDKKTIFFSIFLLTLIVSSVLIGAYILDMHVAIDNVALSETQSSAITQRIMPYKDYYNLGVQIPDISVVTYFDKNCQDTSGFSKFICALTFNIGKPYIASHSKTACIRAVDIANSQIDPVLRDKQFAVAMGWCSHIIQDSDSHNHFVNLAIQRSFLFNGLIHSPAEIWLKDQTTNQEDRVYTRQVLDLGYEMTPFVQQVLQTDPAFSNINIPSLIDFFIQQVQGSTEYHLGFQSFFSIPSYLLWVIGILFLFSIMMFVLFIRRIFNKEFNIPVLFMGITSLIIIILIGLTLYGVFTGTVWQMWEVVSQIIFSYYLYPVIFLFFILSAWLIYDFLRKSNKKQNAPNLLIAAFLILIAFALLPLPNALHAVDPHTQFQLSVDHTKALLNQGTNYIQTIEDPTGFVSIKEAESSGALIRTSFLIALVILFVSILYFAIRRKKPKSGELLKYNNNNLF